MAKKDVDNYFIQICEDYSETLETLREEEEYAMSHVVGEDYLNLLRENAEVVKNNYMRICYIIYLLNLPKNKKKHKWYNNTNKLNIEQNLDYIKAENKQAIENIRNHK